MSVFMEYNLKIEYCKYCKDLKIVMILYIVKIVWKLLIYNLWIVMIFQFSSDLLFLKYFLVFFISINLLIAYVYPERTHPSILFLSQKCELRVELNNH